MFIIKSFSIEKLWGHAPTIKFNLNDKFNFIIGQNGTGKTTVINLIAAALTLDFERLDRIEFERIVIVLREIKGRKTPIIEVEKVKKKDLPYFDFTYRFKGSAKEEPISFTIEQDGLYRGFHPRAIRERMYKERFDDVRQELSTLVKVSWLSVHRNSEDSRAQDDRKYIPAIDQKLKDLNNNLVRYFSQLSKMYSDHTLEFQRRSFLSVLTPEGFDSIFTFAKKLNIEDERKTLGEIFDVLGVEHKHYSHKLKVHFDKLERSVKKNQEGAIKSDDFATLYNSWRAHSLVADYEELQKKKTEIFKPRDIFLKLLNTLFSGRKIISVSAKNELNIATKDSRDIQLEELSSGEKQLLIILGEALLQNSEPVVYIADEPELSLHIMWQEQLTSAISELNRNAQIVFATHSPDIVGGHHDKIINMELVLG